MTTSKSPRQVLFMAWQIGKLTLRRDAQRCRPKKFTPPQLFACLVWKEFLKLDYRGLAELLKDTPPLQSTSVLRTVPHFTTFQNASHEYARHRCHVRSLIPPLRGRPTDKPPTGSWRRQMKSRLPLASDLRLATGKGGKSKP